MKRLRQPAGGGLAATVASVLVAGCLGTSPNVSFFTMNATAVSSTAPAPDGLAIGVGPIRVPRYLDRPEWVTRPGGSNSELEIDQFREWAGGFTANVSSALGQDLGAKLGTQRVVVYPTPSPFALDYRVAVDFHAFEGIGGDALELRATWVIRAGKDAEGGPWIGQSTIRRAIQSSGPQGLANAHDEALALLADAIAARIEDLAAARANTDGSEKASAN